MGMPVVGIFNKAMRPFIELLWSLVFKVYERFSCCGNICIYIYCKRIAAECKMLAGACTHGSLCCWLEQWFWFKQWWRFDVMHLNTLVCNYLFVPNILKRNTCILRIRFYMFLVVMYRLYFFLPFLSYITVCVHLTHSVKDYLLAYLILGTGHFWV